MRSLRSRCSVGLQCFLVWAEYELNFLQFSTYLFCLLPAECGTCLRENRVKQLRSFRSYCLASARVPSFLNTGRIGQVVFLHESMSISMGSFSQGYLYGWKKFSNFYLPLANKKYVNCTFKNSLTDSDSILFWHP